MIAAAPFDAKAAARARAFAAPLLRVEVGFAAAVLAANRKAAAAARPVVLAGGTPDDAARAALGSLLPALEAIGRAWIPRAVRAGWEQGSARIAAAGRRRGGARAAAGSAASWALGGSGAEFRAPRRPRAELAVDFDADWPGVAEYVGARPVAYAPPAARTTVDLFRSAIAAGVDGGLGIDDVVSQVFGLRLPEISRARARLIARTETLSAGNRGNLESYRASGVVESKRWLSTRDDRTRETHRTQDWKRGADVVPLEKPFVLPSKARLMYPGDTSLGAPLGEVVNCRCSIAPEVALP